MKNKNRSFMPILASLAFIMLGSTSVWGNGTEMLGPPQGIDIEPGTGIIAAGTGLENGAGNGSGIGTINIDVPGDVQQALLYWSCFEDSNIASDHDNSLVVEGQNVIGSFIGGPTFFFNKDGFEHHASTHRADITNLGIVNTGANTVSVTGLDCLAGSENGAGLLVIYDDGSDPAEIQIRDGNDLAFINFNGDLKVTVPQAFTFPISTSDRTANLSMFFSSISDDRDRSSVIEIIVDGVKTELNNVLSNNNGPEWDTVNTSVDIPAGATMLIVQAFSEDRENTGNLEASFNWSAAGLSITTPAPPPQGGEGCTPGYWKQKQHFDSWEQFEQTDDYETVFGVDASFDLTLLDALKQGGGGEKALGRHAVAALLNSANPDVSYAFTTDEVIARVRGAYANPTKASFTATKNLFEAENEQGCPLN